MEIFKNKRVSTQRAINVLTLLGFFLVLTTAVGCASVKDAYHNYSRTKTGLYIKTLDRYTAEASVYKGFETVLLAWGTFRSNELRKAYVDKYAVDYHLDKEAKDKLAKQEAESAKGDLEFILAVYPADKKKLNLGTAKSLWKVYLYGAGAKPLTPVEIRRLKKEKPIMEEYYPYMTPWVEVYRVRFPNNGTAVESKTLKLVITGILGTANLTFNLTDTNAR